jgi:putative endonuclease
MNHYFVYILTNKKNGSLYIGFTNDLEQRIYEHKNKIYKSFTAEYNIDKLIYFESLESADSAKLRESQLKKWNRKWKIQLIEKHNPDWKDLSEYFSKPLTEIEKLELLFGKKEI